GKHGVAYPAPKETDFGGHVVAKNSSGLGNDACPRSKARPLPCSAEIEEGDKFCKLGIGETRSLLNGAKVFHYISVEARASEIARPAGSEDFLDLVGRWLIAYQAD